MLNNNKVGSKLCFQLEASELARGIQRTRGLFEP